MNEIKPKLKQDDIIEAEIHDNGMEGEGIASCGDYTVFVPFCLAGEKVKAKVTHVKKNIVFAKLLSVERESEGRVKPPCNRFGRCGGCDLMHAEYSLQLEMKRKNLQRLLKKNAGTEIECPPVVPSSSPYAYRNKISLPFGTVTEYKDGKKTTRTVLGFYREKSHKVVAITKCFLHGDWAEKAIKVFLAYAEKYRLASYDEETGKGTLKHLVVRYLDGQACIVLVTDGSRLDGTEWLVKELDKVFPHYSFYLSPKPEKTNVIMGKTVIPIKTEPFETEVIGVKISINPYSFLQLNSEIRDKIYLRIIEEIAAESESPTVIDAYAGVGILGAALAKMGAKVYNIEIVPEATADGEKIAARNGLVDKITNLNGDAAQLLPDLISRLKATEKANSDNLYLILDPPRKGCDEKVLSEADESDVDKIYYISCNPATLTRDLARLHNYETVYVRPYDMFPCTSHMETLVLLSKKKPDSHIVVDVEFGEGEGKISLKDAMKRAEGRKPKSKTTYKDIQNYVEENYGFKVHTAYIAEVKRNLGLPMYDAPNAVEELKRPRSHPTEKMVLAIKETLAHFEII